MLRRIKIMHFLCTIVNVQRQKVVMINGSVFQEGTLIVNQLSHILNALYQKKKLT